jgi:hypothetical protein
MRTCTTTILAGHQTIVLHFSEGFSEKEVSKLQDFASGFLSKIEVDDPNNLLWIFDHKLDRLECVRRLLDLTPVLSRLGWAQIDVEGKWRENE